jgi:hypothetical protein
MVFFSRWIITFSLCPSSICLWTTQRKKPIYTHALAHGFNDVHSATEGLIQTPRWITAIASLRYSDLFASGVFSPRKIKSIFPADSNRFMGWVRADMEARLQTQVLLPRRDRFHIRDRQFVAVPIAPETFRGEGKLDDT